MAEPVGDIVTTAMMADADTLPKVTTTYENGVFRQFDESTGVELVVNMEPPSYEGPGEPPPPKTTAPARAPKNKASILKRFASRGRK